jgi:hypothetical protein
MNITIVIEGNNLLGLQYAATKSNQTVTQYVQATMDNACADYYKQSQEADYEAIKAKIIAGNIKVADVLALDKVEAK